MHGVRKMLASFRCIYSWPKALKPRRLTHSFLIATSCQGQQYFPLVLPCHRDVDKGLPVEKRGLWRTWGLLLWVWAALGFPPGHARKLGHGEMSHHQGSGLGSQPPEPWPARSWHYLSEEFRGCGMVSADTSVSKVLPVCQCYLHRTILGRNTPSTVFHSFFSLMSFKKSLRVNELKKKVVLTWISYYINQNLPCLNSYYELLLL